MDTNNNKLLSQFACFNEYSRGVMTPEGPARDSRGNKSIQVKCWEHYFWGKTHTRELEPPRSVALSALPLGRTKRRQSERDLMSLDGRTETNPGMSTSSSSLSSSSGSRRAQSRKDKAKNARSLKDELHEASARYSGLMDARTEQVYDKKRERDDQEWAWKTALKEVEIPLAQLDLKVAHKKKLKEWRLVKRRMAHELESDEALAQPKLESEQAKVSNQILELEIHRVELADAIQRQEEAQAKLESEAAIAAKDAFLRDQWLSENFSEGRVEYEWADSEVTAMDILRGDAPIAPLIAGVAIAAAAAVTRVGVLRGFSILKSVNAGGLLCATLYCASFGARWAAWRHGVRHLWSFSLSDMDRGECADLRPDAQALGKLKHRQPLLVDATYKRREFAWSGFLSAFAHLDPTKFQKVSESAHTVAVEVLAQITHQSVGLPNVSDVLVAERIKQCASVCNSVALNRYDNVLGADVVLNTCHLAFGWWKNSQRVRRDLPFPMPPSLGSTTWAV
jgi:hypothetical protein